MPRNGTSSHSTSRFETVDEAIRFYSKRRSAVDRATLVKQYEFLRGEIDGTLAAQLQILSFGTATLGLVTGAAFVGADDAFRDDVLVVFLPLLAYMILIIWFSEVMRMLRAGSFLLKLEKRLDIAGDGSLAWEASVWTGRTKYAVAPDGHMRGSRIRPYYSVFDPDQLRLLAVTLLFFTIAGSSIAMGWDGATAGQRWFAIGVGAVAVLIVLLLYHLRLGQVADLLNFDERPAMTRGIAHVADLLAHDSGETTPRSPSAADGSLRRRGRVPRGHGGI